MDYDWEPPDTVIPDSQPEDDWPEPLAVIPDSEDNESVRPRNAVSFILISLVRSFGLIVNQRLFPPFCKQRDWIFLRS